MRITPTERNFIVNSLRVAARVYRDAATELSDANGRFSRLVEQFETQETQALNLADWLEAEED